MEELVGSTFDREHLAEEDFYHLPAPDCAGLNAYFLSRHLEYHDAGWLKLLCETPGNKWFESSLTATYAFMSFGLLIDHPEY